MFISNLVSYKILVSITNWSIKFDKTVVSDFCKIKVLVLYIMKEIDGLFLITLKQYFDGIYLFVAV
jgi:hypothetical protein